MTAASAIITPALPEISHYFQISHEEINWIMAIFLVGYVIGQPLYGSLSNSIGRVKALRLGLGVNLIGLLVCIIWGEMSYWILLLGRFIAALGSASTFVCSIILINELLDVFKAKRALALNIVFLTVGGAAAVVSGGWVSEYWGWIYCFWVLFVFSVLLFILTYFTSETLHNPLKLDVKNVIQGYTQAIKSKKLLIFGSMASSATAVAFGYAVSSPIYTEEILGLSPIGYSHWNLVAMGGSILGSFCSVYLIKKWDIKKTFFIGIIALFPLFALINYLAFSHTNNLIGYFMTIMLIFFFQGIQSPAALFIASNAIEDKANAAGIMSFVNLGITTICVTILGYLPFSLFKSFTLVTSFFFVVSAILSVWYFLKHKNFEKEISKHTL